MSIAGGSFRRQATLEECLAEAEAQMAALKAEADTDASAEDRRQKAARQRAARERAQRVQQALEELKDVKAKMEKRKKSST